MLTGAEAAYKLVITDITFDDGSADAWTAAKAAWKYKGGDKTEWTALDEDVEIRAAAVAETVTLTIMVENTLSETYAGYSLSFYVALVAIGG